MSTLYCLGTEMLIGQDHYLCHLTGTHLNTISFYLIEKLINDNLLYLLLKSGIAQLLPVIASIFVVLFFF